MPKPPPARVSNSFAISARNCSGATGSDVSLAVVIVSAVIRRCAMFNRLRKTAPWRSERGTRCEHVADHIGMGVGVLSAISRSLDEGAIAGPADIFALLDHDLAARDDSLGVAFDLEALVSAVIDVHVMGVRIEGADRL